MSAGFEEFLTVAEIANVLKLNQQTVRNWIDAGELPAVRVGRRVRVKRSDFDRFVEQGYTGSPRPLQSEVIAETIWDGRIPEPEPPS
ncbi:MAG: helix-turn-helix domain-containing protein [Solirubrobacteraceae bacterium]